MMPLVRARAAGLAALGATAVLTAAPRASADDLAWDMQFQIESDLRLRLEPKSVGDLYTQQVLLPGVERNQNMLGARLSASWENLKAVGQVEMFLFGYQSELQGISSLSNIDEIQPYRFDVRELFVEARDLFVDGLDVRIGQQLVMWGVADQFNPTNNLNSDDLIDPLLFGKQLGNFMVRADYWVTDELSLSGVLVPLFRPARLPLSGQLAVLAIDRLPFLDEQLRWRTTAERAAALSLANKPTAVDQITIQMPEPAFDNMQGAFRMAGTLLEQDWALSYYNGRTDFPQPIANHTRASSKPFCGLRPYEGVCSDGALLTDVTLAYPRMHVYGLNLAGEAGIGYRFEGALVVPQQTEIRLTNDELAVGGFTIPAGEYDYDNDGRPGGKRPLVVDDQPFAKWTLGVDYTLAEKVLVNLMWVHGLADEFGAGDWLGGTKQVRASRNVADDGTLVVACALPRDGGPCAEEVLRPRIGDFLVAGVDVKWLDDQLLTRIFTILELSGYELSTVDVATGERRKESLQFYTPEGFSMVVYPEANYNFGNGLELGAGALFQLGKSYTKFGDPAAGGSVGFVRARFTL